MASCVFNSIKRFTSISPLLVQSRNLSRLQPNFAFDEKPVFNKNLNRKLNHQGKISLKRAQTYLKSSHTDQDIFNCQPNNSQPQELAGSGDSRKNSSEEHLETVMLEIKDNLPLLFVTTLDYTIYHPQLVFENSLTGKKTVGLWHLVKWASWMRVYGHFKFAYVKLDILHITKHPEDSTIKVRWQINGITMIEMIQQMYIQKRFLPTRDVLDAIKRPWLDAFSIFHVNEHGIIDKMTIDRMMPDQEREKVTEKAAAKAAKVIGAIPKSVLFLGFSPDLSQITNVISEC